MYCCKRVLIISANPLSTISNNGKTLASFFDSYPKELLAQLYFSSAEPDSDICSKYFRISDMDLLRSRVAKGNQCGAEVIPNNVADGNVSSDALKTAKIRKNNITRLLREVLWNDNWITDELYCWLDSFQPEVIFFVAGDGIFSYRITEFISEKYRTKLAVYITDDYILPRVSLSPFWWIRRNGVFRYMKKAVKKCNALFTISPAMQQKYRDIFNRESSIAVNMADLLKIPGEEFEDLHGNTLELIYAGGVHLNRDKTLILLAGAIDEINREGYINKKVILKIYSNQTISVKKRKQIEMNDSSVFCGGLSANELAKRLQQADFLVHVESFQYSSMCDTRLSLSTKIPEYMSYKKPIIAIGPSSVASMMYISDCAFCITQRKGIKDKLCNYLKDAELQNIHAEKAYAKYVSNHNKVKNQKKFFEILENM